MRHATPPTGSLPSAGKSSSAVPGISEIVAEQSRRPVKNHVPLVQHQHPVVQLQVSQAVRHDGELLSSAAAPSLPPRAAPPGFRGRRTYFVLRLRVQPAGHFIA